MTAGYKEILDKAIKANKERTFFAQYPEHPKAYGEDAPGKGLEAYKAILGSKFEGLDQGEPTGWIGEEVSPYTLEPLGVQYPKYDVEHLVKQAEATRDVWRKAGPTDRAAVLVDSLERIKERFFEIGHATMHTTGQSFIMSFQASGPHANDRALEAIAFAYEEQQRFPDSTDWVKPMGKFDIQLSKKFKPVPLGIGLVVGCSTFPIWNSIPGIYASLATGNPVIVKPHPKAILPIAIVVEEIQKALKEAGYPAQIIQLAVDSSDNMITKELAIHPSVKLIDYTGGTAFGDYLENLDNKIVFTEKAGVNSVILDSAKDLSAVLQNLAFSVSLYSGQMCTAPQNFFIPAEGVKDGDETVPYEEVVKRLKEAITSLVNHPKMGAGTLGAIQNENTLDRAKKAGELGGKLILEPETVENPEFPNARICTPSIIEVEAEDDLKNEELFGPIILVVKTQDTDHSIKLAQQLARDKGAITCAAYTTDAKTEEAIYDAMEAVATPVSMNLTGFIWVNQHAAFSDFHVTGGNPAGNATFTNPAYVNRRFVWVGHRKVEN